MKPEKKRFDDRNENKTSISDSSKTVGFPRLPSGQATLCCSCSIIGFRCCPFLQVPITCTCTVIKVPWFFYGYSLLWYCISTLINSYNIINKMIMKSILFFFFKSSSDAFYLIQKWNMQLSVKLHTYWIILWAAFQNNFHTYYATISRYQSINNTRITA